jgi:hypothetical protein
LEFFSQIPYLLSLSGSTGGGIGGFWKIATLALGKSFELKSARRLAGLNDEEIEEILVDLLMWLENVWASLGKSVPFLLAISGERTRLECGLRRPASANLAPCGQGCSRFLRCQVGTQQIVAAGRCNPHAGRMCSPETESSAAGSSPYPASEFRIVPPAADSAGVASFSSTRYRAGSRTAFLSGLKMG